MPDLTAPDAAKLARASLAQHYPPMVTRLVNAYGGIYARLQDELADLTAELDELAAKGELPKVWKAGKLKRLKVLKEQVEIEVSRYAQFAEGEISNGAREALNAALNDAPKAVQAALPGLPDVDAGIMGTWQRMDPAAVEAMMGFLSPDSRLLKAMAAKLGPAVADQVAAKLIQAIGVGYNPRKVAAAMKRELGTGLAWSLQTARTTQLNAYREAQRAAYEQNSHIVKGVIRRSARRSNTCLACLSLDGTVYPVGTRIADHHNGACTGLPQTKTYKEMGIDAPEPKRPAGMPATGEEWFKGLPEDRQRAM